MASGSFLIFLFVKAKRGTDISMCEGKKGHRTCLSPIQDTLSLRPCLKMGDGGEFYGDVGSTKRPMSQTRTQCLCFRFRSVLSLDPPAPHKTPAPGGEGKKGGVIETAKYLYEDEKKRIAEKGIKGAIGDLPQHHL